MKKMMGKVLAAVLCASMVTGCSGTGTSETAPAAEPGTTAASSAAAEAPEGSTAAESSDKVYKIALSIPRLSNPFFGRAVDIVQDYAASQGNIEIIMMDAEDESATQIKQIEDAITMQVDGVIAAPITADAFIGAAESLKEAGIPLVTVDRSTNSEDFLAHVGGNNVVGGELAGEYIADAVGTEACKVAILLGTLGTSATLERQQGFNNAMQNYSNITVIEESANFARSDGMTVTENIMQANPDLKAIFTQNEEMGLGAIEALQALGYEPGEVTIVAFDTHVETLAAIDEGWLQGNIEQFPDKQFMTGLDILIAHLKDGSAPAEKLNYLSPELITKDNIQDSEKYGDYTGKE